MLDCVNMVTGLVVAGVTPSVESLPLLPWEIRGWSFVKVVRLLGDIEWTPPWSSGPSWSGESEVKARPVELPGPCGRFDVPEVVISWFGGACESCWFNKVVPCEPAKPCWVSDVPLPFGPTGACWVVVDVCGPWGLPGPTWLLGLVVSCEPAEPCWVVGCSCSVCFVRSPDSIVEVWLSNGKPVVVCNGPRSVVNTFVDI